MLSAWTRVKAKADGKNKQIGTDAAATKLAVAQKKMWLRRAMVQVRHQVPDSQSPLSGQSPASVECDVLSADARS